MNSGGKNRITSQYFVAQEVSTNQSDRWSHMVQKGLKNLVDSKNKNQSRLSKDIQWAKSPSSLRRWAAMASTSAIAFLTRKLNVSWVCLSCLWSNYKYSFEPTIDSMSDVITTASEPDRAGDHQTPSSSQNNPIRDMEAMAIEIHWSLRTRVITLITTSQWTVSTLTPPPPQATAFTTDNFKIMVDTP